MIKQTFKKIIKFSFLSVEIVLFLWFSIYGSHGLYEIKKQQQENKALHLTIAEINKVIQMQEQELQQCEHPFYKEKIAREQLQMVGKNDRVYILS